MPIAKIANKDAREYVRNRIVFDGSNLFARYATDNLYVVYSYGFHFPMYIWDNTCGIWLRNVTEKSASTAKHYSECCPALPVHMTDFSVAEMVSIVDAKGLVGAIKQRVLTGKIGGMYGN